MALLYGRAGRLTTKTGGFWPGQDVPTSRSVQRDDGGTAQRHSLGYIGKSWAAPGTARYSAAALGRYSRVRKMPRLAQKLGQLQPFLAVFPHECTGQLACLWPA